MKPPPQALRVPLDAQHTLLITEGGRDPRAGLAAVVFLGRGQETLGFARVMLALPESRAAASQGWAALNGLPADAFETALVQGAAQLEVVLREMEEASKSKGKSKKDEAQGQTLNLEDPEPWSEEVDGAEVLDELRDTFNKYLVLPVGAAVVMALWTLNTYLTECFEHTPYLAITSPTKRSGKTTTIHVIKAHVRRALSADNVSPAALFRVIEKAAPTLLIDEVDRVQPDSDVWGILNSGHTRGGAVLRTVGENHEPRAFGTYCPKLLAYIRPARSPVPDTVEDRSIRVMIQRRGRGEQREKLRSRILEAAAAPLRRKLARWAEDHQGELAEARPAVPDELDDRATDSWEPLLAIADEAGGEWPSTARALALRFSADRAEEEAEAPGVLLLLDLGALLETGVLKADELGIAGETVVRLLRDLPDRPWRTWGRKGDGITETALARLLRPFGPRPEKEGPRQYRRMRYAETILRAACDRFSPSVRVSETAPTLTPCRTLKTDSVSGSSIRGVRVSGLNPDTEGYKGDTDSDTVKVADVQATAVDPDSYFYKDVVYRLGDTLPDGRVFLESGPVFSKLKVEVIP